MYLVHGCMACNVVCDKTGIKDRISGFRTGNLRSPSILAEQYAISVDLDPEREITPAWLQLWRQSQIVLP